MITMTLVFLFGIVVYVGASESEWGAALVGVLAILLVIGLCSSGRKCDRAFNNFVDHWSKMR